MYRYKTSLCERQQQVAFPDSLDERMKIALSCINTELKSVILMSSTTPVTAPLLTKTFLMAGYQTDRNGFRNQYRCSLIPAGFAYENSCHEKERGIEFSLTAEGKRYGMPLALVALEFARETGISIYSFLGSTISRGKMSCPYNRTSIVTVLNNEGAMSISALVDRTKIDSGNMARHLNALEDIGLVEFRLRDTGKESAAEGFGNGGRIPLYYTKKGTHHGHLVHLRNAERYIKLIKTLTEMLRDEPALDQVLDRIANMRHSQKRELFCDTLKLYDEYAPSRHWREGRERKEEIRKLLKVSPDGLTIKELQERVGGSIPSVRSHVHRLVDEKQVAEVKNGGIITYFASIEQVISGVSPAHPRP